jgi:hypothetical protein
MEEPLFGKVLFVAVRIELPLAAKDQLRSSRAATSPWYIAAVTLSAPHTIVVIRSSIEALGPEAGYI